MMRSVNLEQKLTLMTLFVTVNIIHTQTHTALIDHAEEKNKPIADQIYRDMTAVGGKIACRKRDELRY